MPLNCATVEVADEELKVACLHHMPNRECRQLQELVKVGCDVRYLNDSYRLNGLKATAAQQVRTTSITPRPEASQARKPCGLDNISQDGQAEGLIRRAHVHGFSCTTECRRVSIFGVAPEVYVFLTLEGVLCRPPAGRAQQTARAGRWMGQQEPRGRPAGSPPACLPWRQMTAAVSS